MNINKHNKYILSVCEYTLGFIFYRQQELCGKNMLNDKLPLLEEYRESIFDCILNDNTLCPIDKR